MAKKKKNSSELPVILGIVGALFLSVLILAGFFYFYFKSSQNNPYTLNDTTFCPEEIEVPVTAILIDGTDVISDETVQDIKNKLSDKIAGISRYERIAVYVLGQDRDVSAPVFEKCSPGNVSDFDNLAQKGITANPKMIKERWQSQFWDPVNSALEVSLTITEDSKTSPLFHSLQQIGLNYPGAPEKTIVLISDLQENTPEFSVYESGFNSEIYDSSLAYADFGADYSNSSVEAWVIQRKNTFNVQSELKNFWAQVLTKYGAKQFSTITLVGVQE